MSVLPLNLPKRKVQKKLFQCIKDDENLCVEINEDDHNEEVYVSEDEILTEEYPEEIEEYNENLDEDHEDIEADNVQVDINAKEGDDAEKRRISEKEEVAKCILLWKLARNIHSEDVQSVSNFIG